MDAMTSYDSMPDAPGAAETSLPAALTAFIDLDAIAHNVGVVRAAAGTDVIAVVKANGYGHGAEPVARAALAAGATELGVAHIAEALALREAGIDAHITAWLHTNHAPFDAAIGAETKRFTTDELDRRLADAGIPAAEIRDLEGVVAHPQLSERDRWREVDTEVGPVRALLPPLTFDDVELAMGPVPALGQHTEAVLREFGIGVPPTSSA